ncbi:MAG: alpha/beta hydrolase family protein [Nitriliruptorales bacterium]
MSTIAYGDDPAQVGDLRRGASGTPLVVLVHGGFWRDEWQRDLMDPLAVALTERGYSTWNLEYRRLGPTGGGWPESADDVAAGLEALQRLPLEPPTGPIAVVGHSAGAQLAAVALARWDREPTLFVGLAGLYDLAAAAREGVGWGSVQDLLGGEPADVPEAYEAASPAHADPLGSRQVLIHGTADRHVPLDQSRRQAAAAGAKGDEVELVEIEAADHFDLIAPRGPAWEAVLGALPPLSPGA